MRYCILVSLLVCLLQPYLKGQDTLDTTIIPEKPKASLVSNFVFQFDNRSERYFDVRGRMNGLKIGLEFYKRIRVGLGAYGNNDFYRIQKSAFDDSQLRTARFRYSTLFSELVVFRNFRFEFAVIGAIGGGNIQVNTFDDVGGSPVFKALDTIADIGVRDLGINGHYKIFPWLGVGMGVGYRQVTGLDDELLRSAFNDAYIDFKIKVFLGYAYKSIFKPQMIKQEKAYYDYRREKRTDELKALFDK